MSVKHINLLSLARGTAELGFYVLFPVYFFYHFLVTAGVIPRFLGGLFGPATVVLTLAFGICTRSVLGRYLQAARVVFLGYGLLITHWLAWFIIHHYSTTMPYRDEAAEQVVALLLMTFALFMIGVALPFERDRFHKSMLASLFFIAGLVVVVFDPESLTFNPRGIYDVWDGVASYQGYATSALLVILFLLGSCSKLGSRILLSIGGAALLFCVGARSELYAFIALAVTMIVVESRRSAAVVLLTFSLVSVAAYFVFGNEDLFTGSRQLNVWDLNSDQSWIGRQDYLIVAVRQITEHPFLGVYGGQFEAGDRGTYAHNALSAWVMFGFVGFVLYVALTSGCAVVSVRRYLRDRSSLSIWRYSLYVNVVALLLIIVSKSLFWPIPALGWGLVANTLLRCQIEASRNTRNRNLSPRPTLATK